MRFQDLKIKYTMDNMGNRHTNATYIDEDGFDRGTQLNGHLNDHEVKQSIVRYRQRTKEK